MKRFLILLTAICALASCEVVDGLQDGTTFEIDATMPKSEIKIAFDDQTATTSESIELEWKDKDSIYITDGNRELTFLYSEDGETFTTSEGTLKEGTLYIAEFTNRDSSIDLNNYSSTQSGTSLAHLHEMLYLEAEFTYKEDEAIEFEHTQSIVRIDFNVEHAPKQMTYSDGTNQITVNFEDCKAGNNSAYLLVEPITGERTVTCTLECTESDAPKYEFTTTTSKEYEAGFCYVGEAKFESDEPENPNPNPNPNPDPETDDIITLELDHNDLPSSYPTTAKTVNISGVDFTCLKFADESYSGNFNFNSGGYAYNTTPFGIGVLEVTIEYINGNNYRNIKLMAGDSVNPSTEYTTFIDGNTAVFTLSEPCPYIRLDSTTGHSNADRITIKYSNDPDAVIFSSLTPKALNFNFDSTETKSVTIGGVNIDKATITITPSSDNHFTVTRDGSVIYVTPKSTNDGETYISKTFTVDVDGKTKSFSANHSYENQLNANVKYTGWAELPSEQPEKEGDYYYVYHMRADASSVRNFSACYSKDYMCPVWVAAPMHSCYTGGSGRNDSYKDDPDIPFSQVHKREGYTRGHMLGSSDRTVSVATNKQVFYLSNIAPQLSSGFNTGGGVWNNLEEKTDGQWCADTLYQVIGCHWENTNTHASGTTIPTHYYKALLRTKAGNSGKWVVNCSRDELKCVVFMVEHNSNQHMVKPHEGMLMSVSEVEALTGHTLFPNVPNAPKDTYDPEEWGF